MNPSAIIGALVLWAASVGGTAWWFYGAGQDAETATQSREDKAARVATDAAMRGAAAAIAKIKPQITTIRQETEREIRTNTVYAECKHSPEQLQRINAALTGSAEPAGSGLVPRADAAAGP